MFKILLSEGILESQVWQVMFLMMLFMIGVDFLQDMSFKVAEGDRCEVS